MKEYGNVYANEFILRNMQICKVVTKQKICIFIFYNQIKNGRSKIKANELMVYENKLY